MAKKIIRVAPSILAADFTNLGKDIESVIKGGADWLHIDIMDGHFVPNISYGTPICNAIKDYPIFKDVHLMISKPAEYVDKFIEANADLITFHYEALKYKKDIKELISIIHNAGLACGISIKPNTDVEVLLPFLKDLDVVLIMSVEPGFGGQGFMESSIDKIKKIKNIINENEYECLIEVDGGINQDTGKRCTDAGADILVAGSFVFKSENRKKAINQLRK